MDTHPQHLLRQFTVHLLQVHHTIFGGLPQDKMIFLILLQNKFSVKIHPPHPLTYQEPSLALQTTVRCCTMSVKCSAETHSTPPSRSQVTPDMNILTTGGKRVSVFPGAAPGAPAVYLNTSSGEGRKVLEAAQTAGCPPFTLVAISGLDWNRDMGPMGQPGGIPER